MSIGSSSRHRVFDRISTIDPTDRETWAGRTFLTVDIDWAIDEVLAGTLDVLERAGVPATFFVTHSSVLLARIRANPAFELGIHPNFNPLLDGGAGVDTTARAVVEDLLRVVPEARSIRSHSLTQSSRLLGLCHDLGLSHECNLLLPRQSGVECRPFLHWNGLIRVPHSFEDDVELAYGGADFDLSCVGLGGFEVYDFHPIHVALNTPTLDYYERTRRVHRDATAIRDSTYEGRGVRSWLEELIG